jgi:hypothetical protein
MAMTIVVITFTIAHARDMAAAMVQVMAAPRNG